MSTELLCLGVSHKTAPLALRERLALPEGPAESVLTDLVRGAAISEAVSISTCNRTELYLVTDDPVEAETEALGVLARRAGARPTELTGALYSLRGLDVARHLFSVAAGLDSMIVGEAEIQGQVKTSYERALDQGMTGPVTNRLFRDALTAGKRVRTSTTIGRSHVSISTVAVDLAVTALGDLEGRRALILGTGEQGELTAQALRDRGAHPVFVAGRRHDRAIGLAQRYEGTAARFDDMPSELRTADVLVTATASPHQIITRDDLEPLLEERFERPLVALDIAVPRDIEAGVRELCGVTLYDMDDLQREIAHNIRGREREVPVAGQIVTEAVGEFDTWMRSLDVLPTITALRRRAEEIAAEIVRANEPRFESLSDPDRERVDAIAATIVTRLLHEPTLRLKAAAGEERSLLYAEVLRELFGLDTGEQDQPAEIADIELARRRRA